MKLQSLKNVRCRSLAAAVAATLFVASVAHADVEAGTKLKLAGYIDAAEGSQLMAGKYDDVINKLAPHTIAFASDNVAASTNLCVAYVAVGRLNDAHGACDEAIVLARNDMSGRTLEERMAHEDALSIAVANRAVLAKLAGQ